MTLGSSELPADATNDSALKYGEHACVDPEDNAAMPLLPTLEFEM